MKEDKATRFYFIFRISHFLHSRCIIAYFQANFFNFGVVYLSQNFPEAKFRRFKQEFPFFLNLLCRFLLIVVYALLSLTYRLCLHFLSYTAHLYVICCVIKVSECIFMLLTQFLKSIYSLRVLPNSLSCFYSIIFYYSIYRFYTSKICYLNLITNQRSVCLLFCAFYRTFCFVFVTPALGHTFCTHASPI